MTDHSHKINEPQFLDVSFKPHISGGFIRMRDAPAYLGMDKNRFNKEVRPYLVQIPIGSHGIAFDLLEIKAWMAEYKNRNGRPALRRKVWDVNVRRGSTNVEKSGMSTSKSVDAEFEKVVALTISKKRKNT